MANQEGPFSFNRNPNIGEKTPHAGGDHVPADVRETPHKEGETIHSLDGVNVIFPDTIAEVPLTKEEEALAEARRQQVETTTPPRTPETRKKWYRIGGAVAGLIAAVGVGVGVTSSGSDSEKEPVAKDPTASAPEKTGQDNSHETALDKNVLDMEDIGVSGEKLSIATYDMENEWTNSGLSDEVLNDDERFTMPLEDYAAKIANELDKEYIEKYIVDDWQSNPNLVAYINNKISIHQTNLHIAMITSGSGNGDLAPYRRETRFESSNIASNDAGTLTVNTRWVEWDNRTENRAGQLLTGVDPNTQQGGYTLTFEDTEDGRKIADITPYQG